jgi:hypothetical protein
MNTCKTCHHWHRQEVEVYLDETGIVGLYRAYQQNYLGNLTGKFVRKQTVNYGQCQCPKFSSESIDNPDSLTGEVVNIASDELRHWGDDECKKDPYLVTGKDFGCIHWIKKGD